MLGAGCDLDDAALCSLRDQLYALARAAVLAYEPYQTAAARLDIAERDDVEERAAILEFDGNVPRLEAETIALAQFSRHRPQ